MRSALVKLLICPRRGLRAWVTLGAAFSGDLDAPWPGRGGWGQGRLRCGHLENPGSPGLGGAGLHPDGDTGGLKRRPLRPLPGLGWDSALPASCEESGVSSESLAGSLPGPPAAMCVLSALRFTRPRSLAPRAARPSQAPPIPSSVLSLELNIQGADFECPLGQATWPSSLGQGPEHLLCRVSWGSPALF